MSSSTNEEDVSRSIRIGMIGFGVVGQGLMRLLSERGEEMEARLCGKMECVKIAVRDTSRKREASDDPGNLTESIDEILDDPGIQNGVELAGGVDEPGTWMSRALDS